MEPLDAAVGGLFEDGTEDPDYGEVYVHRGIVGVWMLKRAAHEWPWVGALPAVCHCKSDLRSLYESASDDRVPSLRSARAAVREQRTHHGLHLPAPLDELDA